jgi:hypothetical protein
MEDFDVLGLNEGSKESKSSPSTSPAQTKEPDGKGGDYAGPPGDKKPGDPGGDVDLKGDEPAGHYTYVPVRGDENVGPSGKYASGRGGAKNEAVQENTNGKMVPAFMVPPVPSAQEVAEAEEKQAEEAAEDQLTRAWEVINTYFGEDNDGLNEQGLRGVINAFGFALNTAVEDIALLSSENVRLTEAVNDLNQILKESELQEGKGEKPKFWEKGDEEDDKDDDKDDKDDDKKKDMDYESNQSGSNLLEDASLNSILDEVANIGGSPESQAVTAQSKLIEGYEKAAESASDLVERIVAVIRDDEGLAEDDEIDLPESDQRVQVAQFFYTIAEDAQNYLSRLADGDVAFRVAEEDLTRLHNDIQKGIEAMHHIQ